jgi:hypothetical protein
MDMNKVAESAITGGGLVLLFGAIGLAWRLCKYLLGSLFSKKPQPARKDAGRPEQARSVPKQPHDSATISRAVAAAQKIMESSSARDAVSPENRQYYDFILSAAKAVLDDPQTAGRVGARMAPWG